MTSPRRRARTTTDPGLPQHRRRTGHADTRDSAETPIPVAIETPRGLLVAALRATARPIYPINPLAVARYRERTSISGKKSDHVDAMALANILRTDRHQHRLLPDDSPLA